MSNVKYALVVALLLGTLVLSGIADRRFVWGNSDDDGLRLAASKLESVPTDIGDWRLQSSQRLAPAMIESLQCAGHINRNYINVKTGHTVSLAVIVGAPGPTSVHTPEICYSSRDYEVTNPPTQIKVRPSVKAEESFWSMTLHGRDPSSPELNVIYAWNDGSGWCASRYPRVAYSGARNLFKLQISSRVSSSANHVSDDAAKEFLRDFLVLLERTVFETSSS